MKKYAKIRIKTAKTYAMAIKAAESQDRLKALESSSDPLEKLNFTQENMLLLPILDDILGEGENRNTKGYILIIFSLVFMEIVYKKTLCISTITSRITFVMMCFSQPIF